MKKGIIVFYILISINCCILDPASAEQGEDPKSDLGVGIFYALIYTRERYDETRVIDMKDGTLKVAKYYVVTGIFGQGIDKEYEQNSYLVKKCVQGQVYRPVENDCRGKGTQDNWWGAEKYQWCPTNDRACETLNSSGYYVYDLTKIPAFATCSNDTTANIKWELISLDYYSSVAYLEYVQKNLAEEIPTGDSYFYWDRGRTETENKIFSLSESWINNYFLTKYAPKNSFQYVICTKIKGV